MSYDEEAEQTRYIWEHCTHLMTDLERRVGLAILWRQKAETDSNPATVRLMKERWGGATDQEINSALAEGPEVFRKKVRFRLLAEVGDQIEINRCPRCQRVVQTPKAKQCFWCGHDWHGA